MKYGSRQRWLSLCQRVHVQGDWGAIYDDLVKRYSESHRHYHNLNHVQHCLEEFEAVRALAVKADAVEMAIWFHDAIFDPMSNENEEKSAEFAKRTLLSASLRLPFVEHVVRLILVTKHDCYPEDPDGEVLADVDLAILGLPAEVFDRYEHQIRKEYERFSEKQFQRGRLAILRSLLQRKSIYFTQYLRRRYELSARENIQRSIRKIEKCLRGMS